MMREEPGGRTALRGAFAAASRTTGPRSTGRIGLAGGDGLKRIARRKARDGRAPRTSEPPAAGWAPGASLLLRTTVVAGGVGDGRRCAPDGPSPPRPPSPGNGRGGRTHRVSDGFLRSAVIRRLGRTALGAAQVTGEGNTTALRAIFRSLLLSSHSRAGSAESASAPLPAGPWNLLRQREARARQRRDTPPSEPPGRRRDLGQCAIPRDPLAPRRLRPRWCRRCRARASLRPRLDSKGPADNRAHRDDDAAEPRNDVFTATDHRNRRHIPQVIERRSWRGSMTWKCTSSTPPSGSPGRREG